MTDGRIFRSDNPARKRRPFAVRGGAKNGCQGDALLCTEIKTIRGARGPNRVCSSDTASVIRRPTEKEIDSNRFYDAGTSVVSVG